jgi:DNA-binding transcriptional LysR family regulator
MDLSQLEDFLRVAELGSINRAAKELGLSAARSQPIPVSARA